MTKRLLALILLVSSATVWAQGSRPRLVDLGHPIDASDPTWDGKPGFTRTVTAVIAKDGYTSGRITVDEHFGTHLDAPRHFWAAGWSVEHIPTDRLYRPGVRIDVSAQAAANPDYQVTVADIKAFEARSGA